MESTHSLPLDTYTAAALLEWQLEMGADEPMLDAPLNRYDLPERAEPLPRAGGNAASGAQTSGGQAGGGQSGVDRGAPNVARARRPAPEIHRAPQGPDPVEAAITAAAKATSLDSLREIMGEFEHCEPKKGARNFLFGAGNPQARVLILIDAPSREEDVAAELMTGQNGALFEKMFAAIGLTRDPTDATRSLYLAPVLPWRLPGDREVTGQELAMMQPFLARHVEFIDPDLVVLMGNTPCAAGFGQSLAQSGVTRLRGQWKQAFGKPARAMFSPHFLIAHPAAKRAAWEDLLEIRAHLGL
jgi:uracil-DNA glycosylase